MKNHTNNKQKRTKILAYLIYEIQFYQKSMTLLVLSTSSHLKLSYVGQMCYIRLQNGPNSLSLPLPYGFAILIIALSMWLALAKGFLADVIQNKGLWKHMYNWICSSFSLLPLS